MVKNIYDLVIRNNKKKILMMLFLLLWASLMNILESSALMKIMDDILPECNYEKLVKAILVYIAIALIGSAVSYYCSTFNSVFILRTTINFKRKMIEKIFKRPGAYFSENSKGELYQSIESDTVQFTGFAVNNMFSLFHTIVGLLTAIVFLAVLEWKLLLIILILQPVSALIQSLMGPQLTKLYNEKRSIAGACSSLIQDVISNPVEMIISGYKKNVVGKLEQKFEEQYKTGRKSTRFELLSINIADMIGTLTVCAVIGYSGISIIKGNMSIGELVVFITYSQKIVGGISNIIEFSIDFSEIKPVYDRIINHFSFKPEDKKRIISDVPVIEADNMDFSYNNSKKIYEKINFRFEYGKSYGIIGKTGEGKSTIVKLLFGLWKPDEGFLKICGDNCSDLEYDSVGDVISYVSSTPVILNDTIYNNITLYNNDIPAEKVIDVLKKVELYDEVMSMEGQINCVVGDSGASLSTGQKQRLSLARAMLNKKKIVILDEPTSSLDVITSQKVTDSIFSEFKDCTLVIISHSINVVEKCQKILKLENKSFNESSI